MLITLPNYAQYDTGFSITMSENKHVDLYADGKISIKPSYKNQILLNQKKIDHFGCGINEVESLKDGWDGDDSISFSKFDISVLYSIKKIISREDILSFISHAYLAPNDDEEIAIYLYFMNDYGMDITYNNSDKTIRYIFYCSKESLDFIEEKDELLVVSDDFIVPDHCGDDILTKEILYLIDKYNIYHGYSSNMLVTIPYKEMFYD